MEKGWEGGVCAACLPYAFSNISLFTLSLSPTHSTVSWTTPITTGHLCGSKLMGSCPKDGLDATICLFVNIQHTEAKPPCGYANVWCPGAAHRDANLQAGANRVEWRKWLLDPVSLKGWPGGERPLQAWQCTVFWLRSAPSLSGGLRREREREPPSYFLPLA